MARNKESPGNLRYFDALQQIFKLQSEILTGVLPHPGERGRNDEERFRQFLRKVLPHKFSLGTGFLICSDSSLPPSSQIDIVIFDEVNNSPLHSELAAFVYPVEMVYGIVEVKGRLQSSNLKKCLRDIARVRALAKKKHYIGYSAKQVGEHATDRTVVSSYEIDQSLAPRAFIFAYDAVGWQNPDAFVESWKKALTENRNAHVHGIAVLSKNWFVTQVAHSDTVQLKIHEDNALLRFVNTLTHTLASFPMFQASIDRYLDLNDTPPDSLPLE